MGVLADKTAIITGGGRGIGRAIAIAYAQEGAKVLVAARTVTEIEEVAETIRAGGGEVLAAEADISREADARQLVSQAVDRWGRVDILVNNAGVPGPEGMIHELELTDVETTWAINIRGTFLCSQAVVPFMIQHGGGNIINVSSGAGHRKARKAVRSLAYQISKFAVEGLTNGLAVQLREHKINVNSLLPGPIATRLHHNTPQARFAVLGQPGQPEDVVPAALYLASRLPGAFTDQIVSVKEFNQTRGGAVST